MKAKSCFTESITHWGRLLRSMGNKLLDVAKKGFNEARKALADGTLEASFLQEKKT